MRDREASPGSSLTCRWKFDESCPPRSSCFAINEPIVCEIGRPTHRIDCRPYPLGECLPAGSSALRVAPRYRRHWKQKMAWRLPTVSYQGSTPCQEGRLRWSGAFSRRACAAVFFFFPLSGHSPAGLHRHSPSPRRIRDHLPNPFSLSLANSMALRLRLSPPRMQTNKGRTRSSSARPCLTFV